MRESKNYIPSWSGFRGSSHISSSLRTRNGALKSIFIRWMSGTYLAMFVFMRFHSRVATDWKWISFWYVLHQPLMIKKFVRIKTQTKYCDFSQRLYWFILLSAIKCEASPIYQVRSEVHSSTTMVHFIVLYLELIFIKIHAEVYSSFPAYLLFN